MNCEKIIIKYIRFTPNALKYILINFINLPLFTSALLLHLGTTYTAIHRSSEFVNFDYISIQWHYMVECSHWTSPWTSDNSRRFTPQNASPTLLHDKQTQQKSQSTPEPENSRSGSVETTHTFVVDVPQHRIIDDFNMLLHCLNIRDDDHTSRNMQHDALQQLCQLLSNNSNSLQDEAIRNRLE